MGLQATRFGAHRMAAASRLLPPFLQPPRALPLPRCRVLESSMGRVASELLSATWPEAPGRGLSTRATCEEGRSGRFDEEAAAPEQFSVINFYHLTPIPVPGDEVETHKGFVSKAGLDIK